MIILKKIKIVKVLNNYCRYKYNNEGRFVFEKIRTRVNYDLLRRQDMLGNKSLIGVIMKQCVMSITHGFTHLHNRAMIK